MSGIDKIISQSFIEQMPGGVTVSDLDSKFLMGNKVFLDWSGFNAAVKMIGKTYYDMLCKASEQHEAFIQLDKKAILSAIQILGYYCYQDDNWRVILGEKYPIKDQFGNVCCHVTHGRDITAVSGIYSLDQFINPKRFGDKFSLFTKEQTGFVIEEKLGSDELTTREFECLFFILRGKTAKEIGYLMAVSFRTAEFYITQIKQKFQCSTRSQLIEYAISKGYLNVIPRSLINSK